MVSTLLGLLAGALLASFGRGAAVADDLLVVLLPAVVLGAGILAAATGVEATLDPRHLVTEPVGRLGLGLGMLAAAAIGPPSLLALGAGLGIVVGWSDSVERVLVAAVAVVAWWATLLVFSRALANTLGALASGRFRHVAQLSATLAALAIWALSQIVARDPAGWDDRRWGGLARLAAWTPPGQLGRAVTVTDTPATSLGHLALGASWLPLLVALSVASTWRLATSAPRPGGSGRVRVASGEPQRWLRRVLPGTPAGVLARRTLRTKLRTPRQSVNTATAIAVGAGVFFLGPLLGGGAIDPRLVVAGGLIHIAVLFDGNNAYGMDGAQLWIDVAAGADAGVLVRAKVLSSLVVMLPVALVVPVGLAALSGGWAWVPAGWLIGIGSVLGAAGVAVASAALAPVAMPDSPNPLAAGDTGQGCVAGLMLSASVLVLALATAPLALVVLWASTRSPALTAAVSLAAPLAGAALLWGGESVARARLAGREPRLVELVTPAR